MLLPTAWTSAWANDVALGGIVISVSDSWTAQLFHIVDQLSEWNQASHRQYGRWAAKALSLDEQDRKLLQDHAYASAKHLGGETDTRFFTLRIPSSSLFRRPSTV